MSRVRVSILLAVCGIAALAGCGGSDSGSGDEDEISGVLETAFTTADPVQCEQVTDRGLEQLSPGITKQEDPVAACKELVDESASADSIQLSGLEVDGDAASVKVTPQGGPYAGATVTVDMVDDGGWKLDSLGDFQITDRKAYLSSLADSAVSSTFGTDAILPRDARCITDRIAEDTPTAELERSLSSGDKDYIYDAINLCMGGGIDLIAMTTMIHNQLVASGVNEGQATCLSGLAIAGFKGLTIKRFAESKQAKGRIAKVLRKGAQFCVPAKDQG